MSIDDADYDESSGSINSIDDTTVTITIDGIDVATLGGSPIDETSADSGIFEDSVDWNQHGWHRRRRGKDRNL